jgi:hypothetical protein
VKLFKIAEADTDENGYQMYNVYQDGVELGRGLIFKDAQHLVLAHITHKDSYQETCALGNIVVECTGEDFIHQQIELHRWENEGGAHD